MLTGIFSRPFFSWLRSPPSFSPRKHIHFFVAYGSSQARDRIQSFSCWPTPQPQPCQIWAASVTDTTAHGNTRSLTCWARPGIKPATSWLLVRFVSPAPRQEPPRKHILPLDFLIPSVKTENQSILLKRWLCVSFLSCLFQSIVTEINVFLILKFLLRQ